MAGKSAKNKKSGENRKSKSVAKTGSILIQSMNGSPNEGAPKSQTHPA